MGSQIRKGQDQKDNALTVESKIFVFPSSVHQMCSGKRIPHMAIISAATHVPAVGSCSFWQALSEALTVLNALPESQTIATS